MLDQASFSGITVAVLSGSPFTVASWLFSVHAVMVVCAEVWWLHGASDQGLQCAWCDDVFNAKSGAVTMNS